MPWVIHLKTPVGAAEGDQRKQIVEESLDETRAERFGLFMQTLDDHPMPPGDVRTL